MTSATAANNRVVQVINQALHQEFEKDARRVLIGEDILDPYGGAFKVSKGLSERFPDRVLTSPISEGAITGIGAGMALRGMRPIVEIMFGDFVTLAFDQLLNGISKFRSMYNGQVECSIVLRTPMGGRRGYGPTHSQSLDKFLIAIPNIKVIAPSVVHDVLRLYQAIFSESCPVVIVENKTMYGELVRFSESGRIGNFSVSYTNEQFPVATLSINNFDAADITLVCYGGMTSIAMSAVEKLYLEEEIAVELVIPSRIGPVEPVYLESSLTRSGRLLVVEEGTECCGFGAELVSFAAQNFFNLLKSAPIRLAAANDIIPSSKSLEQDFLVDQDDICRAVCALLR